MKKLLLALPFLLFGPSANAESDQSAAIAQLTSKITQMEEENRRLNGRIEELEHSLSQLRGEIAESKIKAAGVESATPPLPGTGGLRPLLGQPGVVTESSAADGSKVLKFNPYVTKVTTQETPRETPGNETAEAEFDDIFQSVASEDYKTAKPALKAFVLKHPGTSMAGEAYFWLGEMAWSEHDYNNAAINYLKGYTEAPKGEKASENILKMALTLKELGKKDEACKYIDRFSREFPDAHRDLRNKANTAKIELGCK